MILLQTGVAKLSQQPDNLGPYPDNLYRQPDNLAAQPDNLFTGLPHQLTKMLPQPQQFFDIAQTRTSLTKAGSLPSIHHDTPAMPLTDAHFGGFFVFSVRQYPYLLPIWPSSTRLTAALAHRNQNRMHQFYKTCRVCIKVTALLTQLLKAHRQVTSSRSKHPSGQNFYPLNALKGDRA
jgi:hypothetical protein